MTDMPLSTEFVAEPILKRDRVVLVTFLSTVVVLAWAYTLASVGMEKSSFEVTVQAGQLGSLTAQPSVWSLPEAGAVFARWGMIIIAMMVPAVAPAVVLFMGIRRKKHQHSIAYVSTGLFLFGFVAIWLAFCLAATSIQWWLQLSSYMSAAMSIADSKLAGGVYIAAGLYQFTGVKQSSLKQFRSPLHYLNSNWRDGSLGAFKLGWEHGAFSLGSNWCLMALLLVGGFMNVFWIIGLAGYVLLEKFNRHGSLLSIAFGCAVTCWGIFVLGTALRP